MKSITHVSMRRPGRLDKSLTGRRALFVNYQ